MDFLRGALLMGTLTLTSSQTNFEHEMCQCAFFDNDFMPGSCIPVLSWTTRLKANHENGNEMIRCRELCLTWAKNRPGTEELILQYMCSMIEDHTDNLKPAVYFKTSKIEEWAYSGFKYSERTCCHNEHRVACTAKEITQGRSKQEEPDDYLKSEHKEICIQKTLEFQQKEKQKEEDRLKSFHFEI